MSLNDIGKGVLIALLVLLLIYAFTNLWPTAALAQTPTATPEPTPIRIGISTGGTRVSSIISAATTNRLVIKDSPGQVCGWDVRNYGAAPAWLKVYSLRTQPVFASDVPAFQVAIPAGSATEPGGANVLGGNCIQLSTGISIAITGGQAATDATAVDAGQVEATIAYK